MTVCERIDLELKKRKMSRRQLAIQAGIPPSSFQSAMQRNGNLSSDMIFKISDALLLPTDYLIFGYTQADIEEQMNALCAYADQHSEEVFYAEAIGILGSLNVKGLEKAIEMLKIILDNPNYKKSEAELLEEAGFPINYRARKSSQAQEPPQSTGETPTPDAEKNGGEEE